MKFTLFLLLTILLISAGCEEELLVEQNNTIMDQVQLNKIAIEHISKEKKEKIEKLKKAHQLPYVVLEKPEDLLRSKIFKNHSSNSLSKKTENTGTKDQTASQSCFTVLIDVWAFEKYNSKPGYNVGIWPKGSFNYPDNLYWMYNQSILNLLRNTYGFNKIALERAAINSNTVYPANEIMAGIDGCKPELVISSYSDYTGPSFWGCYTDEPFSRTTDPMPDAYTARLLLNLTKTWWQTKFGQNSVFIVGETTVSEAQKISGVSDYVNCSWYGNWWEGYDQRSRWTDFNSNFNTKFNHVWLSGELDQGEMDQLIGHARNMMKYNIWLYAAELNTGDATYWNSIYELCYYAFVHSFLNRVERKYIYVYNYVGYDDPCYDYQITSWDLIDIIDSGLTRTLSNN